MTEDVADAVPHEPLASPWVFQRINEHGHTGISAQRVEVDSPDGTPPLTSHARVYLSDGGPHIGTATVTPNGDGTVRVEGVVHDHRLGGRLIRHVGFNGIAVTHSRVTIDERELGE